MNPNPSRIPKFVSAQIHANENTITNFGTHLMPPDRRFFPSGAAGAPTAPARARTPRRRSLRGTRGTDTSIAGRRARGRRRHQMVAGSPACTTTFTPRTKTTAATTVDGGARRTWSCARSSGNRGHRVEMKQGGGRRVRRRRWRRSPPLSQTLAPK
jgi:hypothetical protein